MRKLEEKIENLRLARDTVHQMSETKEELLLAAYSSLSVLNEPVNLSMF